MITDAQAEAANDFIRDNASAISHAKGNRIYLEEFRKTKKSILIQNTTGTVLERESYAYSHPEYIEVIEALRSAVQEEERLKWLMIAAQAKIEMWRTQSANDRRGV
jgi:hypothetical protein